MLNPGEPIARRPIRPICLGLVLLLALCGQVWAGGVTITGLNVLAKKGMLFVEINLTVPLAPKVVRVLERPDRPMLALDFLGADGPDLPEYIASPSPLAAAVRVGRHKDKLRIVIDLIPGKHYVAEQALFQDSSRYVLGLRFDTDRQAPEASPAPPQAATPPPAPAPESPTPSQAAPAEARTAPPVASPETPIPKPAQPAGVASTPQEIVPRSETAPEPEEKAGEESSQAEEEKPSRYRILFDREGGD